MLAYKEFEIVNFILKNGNSDSNTIFKGINYHVFDSAEEVDSILKTLINKNIISNGKVTELGLNEIASYKVDNAIILAAGGEDINAKSVYSMPKGLFVKNGETLIERQIRQLKEVGINDITVVIAYKQELYFFLQDKWGVNLEINPDLKRNNIYSLFIAKKFLKNTYILNCDNYFETNPFSAYEYNSYHATVHKDNAQNELLVEKGKSGRITKVFSGAASGECLYGHAYLDKEVSSQLVKYMETEIEDFRFNKLFWEEFCARHFDDIEIFARQYTNDFVFEFDSIQEIQNVEGLFLDTVSERINSKICEVFNCKKEDIKNIKILQKGLTNILFTFDVEGKTYIFRYPGDSSQFFIYRENECIAQKIAAKAHADDTYIYIDETGIKISLFRKNCLDIHGKYYFDMDLMKRIARKIRAFHDEGRKYDNLEQYNYDPVYQCERLFREASKVKGNLFEIFEKEWEQVRLLQKYADNDNSGIKKTMCHNDINIDNVLCTENSLDIIDWEFAGYNDPGYDFGRVIAGLDYEADDERVDIILEAYFGRKPTIKEKMHFIAYSALHNWYYVGWALYKESINESSRDWMLFFFKQTKKLIDYCLKYYQFYK